MKQQAFAVLLLSLFLTGCAAVAREELLVREAFQERQAAYARLARAIGAYCSMRYDSLADRQACVQEKSLEVARINATDLPPLESREGSAPSILSCERARSLTTCRRIPPLQAELDKG